MFRKTGKVRSLGWATFEDGALRMSRTAQLTAPSYFLADGARAINVEAVLRETAERFAISPNPRDYLFEIIRANSTGVPNDNHDAFPKSQLLTWNTRLGKPVYLTYQNKPHHVDHKTDNPREARGVILDAHYAEETPALETCPRCASRTASIEARTPDGIFCRRCGCCVKDEGVEILVGVDRMKDPPFAAGVLDGTLRLGSMGCNCVSTECRVCGHIAYDPRQFCSHIRAGAKGQLFTKDASHPEGWRRIDLPEVVREMERRAYRYDPTDFCWVVADDGFEVRRAYENCQDIIFDEYSRVRQPADPKAVQQEVLHVHASSPAPGLDLEALHRESEQLVREAKMSNNATRRAQVAPPGPGPTPMPGAPGAPDAGPPGAGAPPPGAAMAPGTNGNVRMEFEVPPDYRVMIQPPDGGEPLEVAQPNGPPNGGPDDEEPEQMSNSEMGIVGPGEDLPPPASKGARVQSIAPEGPFAESYGEFRVKVTASGTVIVESPAGPVMLVRAKRRIASREDRTRFGEQVMLSLYQDGFLATAKKYEASFPPRLADITDMAINDMRGMSDRARGSAIEGGTHDMRSVSRTPSKSSLEGGGGANDDMKGMTRPRVPTTLSERITDHKTETTTPGALSSVDQNRDDMRGQQRTEFSMGRSNVNDGGTRDMRNVSPRKGQRVTPVNASAPAPVDAGRAEHAERLRKLYATRLEAEKKAFEEAYAARFQRALRIAGKKRLFDEEGSPLKSEVWEKFGSTQVVGHTDEGAPIECQPLHEDVTTFLTQSAFQASYEKELEGVFLRAAEIMAFGDQYIADAERDMSRRASVQLPRISSEALAGVVDDDQRHAAALRHQAMNGNPIFAPAPEVDAGPEVLGSASPTDELRRAVRASLQDTKVGLVLNDYTSVNGFRNGTN